MTNVLMPTEVKLGKLNYGTPVAEKGYHKSSVTYDNNQVLIQTPPLTLVESDPKNIVMSITKNKKQENSG